VELSIGRLDRWRASNRPDNDAHLLPGVPDAQLDAFESRFARLAGIVCQHPRPPRRTFSRLHPKTLRNLLRPL
jgi:hypothetical protein